MITENDLKQKIAEAKVKLSTLDVAISHIDRFHNLAKLQDDHIPTDGQPFTYMFTQPTTALGALTSTPNGILIPGETAAVLSTRSNPDQVFSGIVKMDGDSTFVCTDIQGVQLINWTNPGVDAQPPTGAYWAPLTRSDLGRMVSADALQFLAHDPYFCSDFGFRFVDEGTQRRLFQVNSATNNDDVFIPAKFLGNGMPYATPFGPNFTNSLDFQHVFAKNTVIRCDIKPYNSCEQVPAAVGNAVTAIDVRVFIGLIGYKVYGD